MVKKKKILNVNCNFINIKWYYSFNEIFGKIECECYLRFDNVLMVLFLIWGI